MTVLVPLVILPINNQCNIYEMMLKCLLKNDTIIITCSIPRRETMAMFTHQFKRIFVISIAVALTLLLGACGNNPGKLTK